MYAHSKQYDGRRVKSKNFSDRELNVLLDLVTKRFKLIENKKTDTNSCRDKTIAWENIAAEYNNQIGLDPYRSAQQLRTCYDNIKRRLRRELAEDKLKRSRDTNHVRKLSESSERLLILLSNFHKTDGEIIARSRTQSDDQLFLIEDDSESHEHDTSHFTQSEEEEEVNSTMNHYCASDLNETKRKLLEDGVIVKRKREDITITDVYNNLNEVLNSRRKKTVEEEAYVKRRREIVLETEEVNLRNARMQERILENNLKISELELQIKEKMLKSMEK